MVDRVASMHCVTGGACHGIGMVIQVRYRVTVTILRKSPGSCYRFVVILGEYD